MDIIEYAHSESTRASYFYYLILIVFFYSGSFLQRWGIFLTVNKFNRILSLFFFFFFKVCVSGKYFQNINVSFRKFYTKLWGEQSDIIEYATANQPDLILSASVNRTYLNLLLVNHQYNTFYSYAITLQKVHTLSIVYLLYLIVDLVYYLCICNTQFAKSTGKLVPCINSHSYPPFPFFFPFLYVLIYFIRLKIGNKRNKICRASEGYNEQFLCTSGCLPQRVSRSSCV